MLPQFQVYIHAFRDTWISQISLLDRSRRSFFIFIHERWKKVSSWRSLDDDLLACRSWLVACMESRGFEATYKAEDDHIFKETKTAPRLGTTLFIVLVSGHPRKSRSAWWKFSDRSATMEKNDPTFVASALGLEAPYSNRHPGQSVSHVTIGGHARVQIGNSYGHTGVPPQPERGRVCTVPFNRDKHFVHRGTVIKDLLSHLKKDDHSRAALFGMGGVGYDRLLASVVARTDYLTDSKTQLAIEFAYAYQDQHHDAAIFWLFAGSTDRLLESYTRIAHDLKLPGYQDKETDKFELVENYLSDRKHGEWLLIMDNLDELSGHTSDNGKRSTLEIALSLPQTKGGFVLITTRDSRIANRITGSEDRRFAIEPMSTEDAMLLLETKVEDYTLRSSHVEELVSELGLLPLAITQAAAYMTDYRCNTVEYLEQLRRIPSGMLGDDQSQEIRLDLRRDRSQQHAVYTTIQVTIARLDKNSPATVELLMSMALCDQQSIPRYLLEVAFKDIRAAQELKDYLRSLQCLSLIKTDNNGTRYSMHPLAQGAILSWRRKKTPGIDDTVRKLVAIGLIEAWSDDRSGEDWRKRWELHPHMRKVSDDASRMPATPLWRVMRRILCLYCSINLFLVHRYQEGVVYSQLAKETETWDEEVLTGLDATDQALANRLFFAVHKKVSSRSEVYEAGYLRAKATTEPRTCLRENVEAELVLCRVLELCQKDYELGSEEFRDEIMETYRDLAQAYLERYLHWHEWGLESSTGSAPQSRMSFLLLAEDMSLRNIALIQESTAIGCAHTIKAIAGLGMFARVLARGLKLRQAEATYRHLLCMCLKNPGFDKAHLKDLFQFVALNKIRKALREPEETAEAFIAQHARCKYGYHGCLFYGAELD